MTCAHCAAVAQEVVSLRDEVENWRAWGRPTPVAVEAERVTFWRRVLPMEPGPMRALLRLIDARGSSIGFDVLTQRPGMGDVDVGGLAKNYVCRARSALAAAGVSIEIIAVRGYGYMIDRAAGERLLALVEGSGDA